MEKEQLLKQNQQLTFDLEKARETIQAKNKEILKVRVPFYPVCINFIYSPAFVHSMEWLSPKTTWIIVKKYFFTDSGKYSEFRGADKREVFKAEENGG